MARGFQWTQDEITPGLQGLESKIHSMLSTFTEYYSDVAMGHARRNAPWTDQTGNARQGLFAQAFTSPQRYSIVIYHTMPYGIWLEVRWSGRYAIILPTIETVGPKIMRDLRRLMVRIR